MKPSCWGRAGFLEIGACGERMYQVLCSLRAEKCECIRYCAHREVNSANVSGIVLSISCGRPLFRPPVPRKVSIILGGFGIADYSLEGPSKRGTLGRNDLERFP